MLASVYRKVIQLYIYLFFFQLFPPFRLSQNIESSSLCHTGGPCGLSVLNRVVFIHYFMHPTNTECPLFEYIRRRRYQKYKMGSYLQWVFLHLEGERKRKPHFISHIESLIWEQMLIGTFCLGCEYICYSTTHALWVSQNWNPFRS